MARPLSRSTPGLRDSTFLECQSVVEGTSRARRWNNSLIFINPRIRKLLDDASRVPIPEVPSMHPQATTSSATSYLSREEGSA